MKQLLTNKGAVRGSAPTGKIGSFHKPTDSKSKPSHSFVPSKGGPSGSRLASQTSKPSRKGK